MTRTIEVHVGETLEDIGLRFVDAWERAEAGESVVEDHLSFESWAALARHLPKGGIALLRAIESHPTDDVFALARRVGQEPAEIEPAIAELSAIGLVDRSADGFHAVRLKMPRSA